MDRSIITDYSRDMREKTCSFEIGYLLNLEKVINEKTKYIIIYNEEYDKFSSRIVIAIYTSISTWGRGSLTLPT